MVWGNKALLFVVLPFTAVCGFMMYYFYKKDDEWQEYIKSLSQVCVEVKVPKDTIGAVIGRGGSNIKEIQEKTGAKIKFRDDSNNSDFRTCKVRGLKQNVEMAVQLIKESVILENSLQTYKMWVPAQACGRIIGRSGDNIRAIGNSSNASINLEKFSNFEDRKLVTIKGTDEQIEIAKNLILLKIQEDEESRNKFTNKSSFKRFKKTKRIDPGFEKLVASENDSSAQVYVSAVINPNHFFIQLAKSGDLDRLVDNMTEYYNVEANQVEHKLSRVEVGDFVALCNRSMESKWYRVKVMGITEPEVQDPDTTIDIFYLDYGESSYEKLEHLFFLKDEYLSLKFQAIETKMLGIVPKDNTRKWCEESISGFEDLVLERNWQLLMAEVTGYCQSFDGNVIPCIRLFDPSGATTDIAKRMVELGLADFEKNESSDNNSDVENGQKTDAQNDVKTPSTKNIEDKTPLKLNEESLLNQTFAEDSLNSTLDEQLSKKKIEKETPFKLNEESVLNRTFFEDSLNSTFDEQLSNITLSPPKSILNVLNDNIKTESNENLDDFESFKGEDTFSDISVDDLNIPEFPRSN